MQRIFSLFAVLLFTTAPAWADFNQQMNKMFGSMTNVTSPQSYMDQSRGVISGGRLTVKNKIVSNQLISFDPMRIDSGCGGIDWFGGSMSFISADEFVQSIRAIGSNAAGYAFKLALSNICPSCAAIMEDLRKAAHAINSIAGDSCQTGQFLVDAIADKTSFSMGDGIENVAGQVQQKTGKVADAAQGWLNKYNQSRSSFNDLSPDERAKLEGNIAWIVINQLGSNGGKMLASYESSSRQMAEAIMSLTGTIIVKQADAAHEGNTADDKAMATPEVKPIAKTLSLRQLMGEQNKETTVSLLKCDSISGILSQQCLIPTVTEDRVSIEPMIAKVRRILLGSTASPLGLVQKFVTNTGTINAEEKAFMELAPVHGRRIRDLAIFGSSGATLYAERAAEKIALDLVSELVHSIVDSVSASAAVSTHNNTSTFINRLADVKSQLYLEQQSIAQSIQTEESVTEFFNSLMMATDRSRYRHIVSELENRQRESMTSNE